MPKQTLSESTTSRKALLMIEQVKAKKAEIKDVKEYGYQTSMTFSYTEGRQADTINLRASDIDLETLLKVAGFLHQQHQGYARAAALYEIVDFPKMMWQGYTIHQWWKDIGLCIKVLRLNDEQYKLEILERRLDAVISPELHPQTKLTIFKETP